MTFTEAAALVLRLVGKPLHYKEITDVAIEKNLLSHVGKSPEVTMGARLAALVKKHDRDNPLVRIKPGVFALREWDDKTIEQGLADRTPALERIAQQPDIPIPSVSPEAPTAALARAGGDEGAAQPDAQEIARGQLAAEATAFFASEEDDDEPIFGGAPAASAAAEGAAGEEAGQRGRRRGRRRRNGDDAGRDAGGGDDLPGYTVSDAPADLDLEALEPRREEPRERDRERDREPRRDEPRREREARRERDDGRMDVRGPLDDLTGVELAQQLHQVLLGFDKGQGPVPIGRLVEQLQRRGKWGAEPSQAQALVQAVLRADNLRRSAAGQRPRFRLSGGRAAPTDWAMDPELLRLEREAQSAVERYRDVARRQLMRRLQELTPRAGTELFALLFERLGITELTLIKRPGAPPAELHFAGRQRGPMGEAHLALLVRQDGREVGRERVSELRGTLHHYGSASAGVILTTGQVLSGAREEAAAAGAAPVALYDGLALAKLCEEQGVGVKLTQLPLPQLDLELFEALRGA